MQVAITGLGCVSPFGVGARAIWDAMLARRTAFDRVSVTADGLPPCGPILAARVPSSAPEDVLGRKGLRAINPESQFFVAASTLALHDAGVEARSPSSSEVGVFVGTTRAGMDDYILFHLERLIWGPARVTPTRGPNTGFNAPASHAAIRFAFHGSNLTFSNRTTASLDAVAHAADFIRRGRCRMMIVGGIDRLSDSVIRSLYADGSVPSAPPRPYDIDRSLPVLGEGAVAIVLESLESARARGARVLATVGAWSTSFAPGSPDALAAVGARSLRNALKRDSNGVGLDALFSSASGDRTTDAAEAAGFAEVLAGDLERTPVCAVKGCAGEWHGAGGALQVLTAVMALAEQTVPPTSGTTVLDPALPRLLIPDKPLLRPMHRVAVHVLDAAGRSSTLTLNRLQD